MTAKGRKENPDISPLLQSTDRSMSDDVQELNTLLKSIKEELKAVRKARATVPWWFSILAGLAVAGILGAHGSIWHNNNRLTALENSAFSEAEALRMEARIISQINQLPITIERLDDHEARIRRLESGGHP